MNMNFKTLPHCLEAEQSILGVLIINENKMQDVIDQLNHLHFYVKEHQIIFKAMCSIYLAKRNIDSVTLAHELTAMEQLEYVGGMDYLVNLAQSVMPNFNVENYAQIIIENWELRQIIEISQDLSTSAYSCKNISTILDDAEKKLYAIRSSNYTEKLETYEEVLINMVDDMQKKANGEVSTTTPTGFNYLDEMINGGFEEGELIIIAGRPGMGKTSLITNMVINMIGKKHGVIMFSIEMTNMQIAQRITANLAQVSSNAIKVPKLLTTNDHDKILECLVAHKHEPLHFIPQHNPTITSIKSYCRKISSNIIKNNLDKLSCVVIDHLGLIQLRNQDENLAKSLAEITRELKVLAQELKVPIVLLCQLNRNVESRAVKRPMLSDLRDSGAIEQDADKVLLLYREDYYHSDKSKHNNNTTIIVAKNRDGELGEVNLSFDGKFNKLSTNTNNYDWSYSKAGDTK